MLPANIKSKGYTLLELLVVLGMIGILAAVAVPSFAVQIQQNRLTSSANNLHSIFKFARSEAAKREQTVNLVSSASGSQWKVMLGGTEQLSVFTPSHDSVYIKDGLTDLEITATGSTSNSYFLITDGDDDTDDYCLSIYISGQSKLAKQGTCS